MNGNEKRLNEIKLRLEDSAFNRLALLANLDDRTLTDYIHHIVVMHVFGHGARLDAAIECSNKSDRG